MSHMNIIPTGAALGAEVHNLDLSQPLDDAAVDQLQRAFHQHSVLLFRQQQLTPAEQVRFTGYFGTAVPHPTNTRDRDPDVAEITVISNIEEEGRAVGALGNAEVHFHADLVFLHEPGAVSILYCVETPDSGGDTMWTSGYAGYDALDRETKARIDDRNAIYVHRNSDYNPPTPATHPLAPTHPETGRKTLFISPSSADSVEGMDEAAGQTLLAQLMEHATQEQFIWRHTWQPGDLIMWDNRCTLHRREAFDNSQRRLMRRTQTLGAPSEN